MSLMILQDHNQMVFFQNEVNIPSKWIDEVKVVIVDQIIFLL